MRLLNKIVITTAILLTFTNSCLVAENSEKKQYISSYLLSSINAYHYSPKTINDNFSKESFNLYIKRLDPNKRFLTQNNIEELKKFEFLIDDELRSGKNELFHLSKGIITNQINEVKSFIDEIFTQPFDFTKNESITLDPKKLEFCSDSNSLKERWRKTAKYQTLNTYRQLIDAEKNKTASQNSKEQIPTGNKTKAKKIVQKEPSDLKPVSINPEIEKKARKKVNDSINKSLERMLKEKEEDRFAIYLDSIANCFDPHTSYYPPQKKEDFDIDISGRLEGIGALLREEEGFIKVVRIIPGSASWKQKELKAGDIIIKVAQGSETPVDITNARVQDAVKVIRGKKGTEVRLTVKKPNGNITIIPIIRDVVVIEETYAKSCILVNKNIDKQFGYIYLPSFYHDFKRLESRSAASDIAKELISFQKLNLDGLILDLRNNGGGALTDAVKVSGLFIKSGPIVQVKDKYNIEKVLKDNDPRVFYKGPLVVMISALSASASEILAGALQDYDRAVILGGPHSFGKGTVQTFIDMDKYGKIPPALKPLGSVKLTIQKFYRINGNSTQYKGVIPDIILPDTNSILDIGEKKLDYSLPWDTVKSLSYRKWDNPPNIPLLKDKSKQRIEKNKTIQFLKKYTNKLEKRQKNKTAPLNLIEAITKQNMIKSESKELKEIQQPYTYLEISTQNITSTNKNPDPEQEKNLQEWYNQISKDTYINEAMFILNDMIF
jgi:carboxyl-terminal processing protease